MAERKDFTGRDPDKRSETNNQSSKPDPEPSIAERVKSSASGLLRSSITPSNPAAHSFGNDLSNALSSKPSAPSSSSSSLSSSSNQAALAHPFRSSSSGSLSSTGNGESTGVAGGSFRSSWTSTSEADNQEKAWEQQFFGDGAPVNSILDQHDLSQSKGKGPLENIQPPAATHQQPETANMTLFDRTWHAFNQDQELRPRLHHEGQARDTQTPEDGLEVSALLSDPSFQPLYHEDTSDIDQMRGFEIKPGTTMPPKPFKGSITPLHLVPDMETVRESFAKLLPNESVEEITRGLGIYEWLTLDTEYQDTVWGDLKPYAEDAVKEVEAKHEAGDSDFASGPAVMRLKMVLGHLKDKRVER